LTHVFAFVLSNGREALGEVRLLRFVFLTQDLAVDAAVIKCAILANPSSVLNK
jgi:hypothetical protein